MNVGVGSLEVGWQYMASCPANPGTTMFCDAHMAPEVPRAPPTRPDGGYV